jgi:transcription initiation factor TFIIIB Brf1 subunit/transcription initiation factor TFIIB
MVCPDCDSKKVSFKEEDEKYYCEDCKCIFTNINKIKRRKYESNIRRLESSYKRDTERS